LAFTLKATTTHGQFNKAELRVVYGKQTSEVVIPTEFTQGATTEAHAEISVEDAPLAAGMPVSYYWIIGNSSGDLARTDTKVVTYEDTRFSWRQRTGLYVTVRWYNGDEDYGNLMYTLANDALATYKRRFSMSPYEHIYISIYGSSQEYFEASPDVPSWSGGYTLAERNEILAIAPQHQLASILIGEGIPHELSHAALFQFLGHRHAPRWLDEGFAVYNQNVIAPEYDEIVQSAYRTNSIIPLANLNRNFPSDAAQAKLAYAEGRSMVTFLINNYNDAVWANLLDQLRYNSVDQAFQKVFGTNLATMEGYWRSSLGGKKPALPAALLKGPVSATPSPPPTTVPGSSLEIGTFAIVLLLAIGVLGVFGLAFYLMRRSKRLDDPDYQYQQALKDAGITDRLNQVAAPAAPVFQSSQYNPAGRLPELPPTLHSYAPNFSPLPPIQSPYTPPGSGNHPGNNDPDPFDIIAATFGNPAPTGNNFPYNAPPAADGGQDPPPPVYRPNKAEPPADPYGLGQNRP
jgi:hypothetical protein